MINIQTLDKKLNLLLHLSLYNFLNELVCKKLRTKKILLSTDALIGGKK